MSVTIFIIVPRRFPTIDSLAAAGAILASVWTPNNIPTVDEVGQEFLDHVKDGMTIEIRANGEVLVTD